MSGYNYSDPTGGKISISRIIDGHVRVFVRDSDFSGASVNIPAAERQAAAQAIAGDEWQARIDAAREQVRRVRTVVNEWDSADPDRPNHGLWLAVRRALDGTP